MDITLKSKDLLFDLLLFMFCVFQDIIPASKTLQSLDPASIDALAFSRIIPDLQVNHEKINRRKGVIIREALGFRIFVDLSHHHTI